MRNQSFKEIESSHCVSQLRSWPCASVKPILQNACENPFTVNDRIPLMVLPKSLCQILALFDFFQQTKKYDWSAINFASNISPDHLPQQEMLLVSRKYEASSGLFWAPKLSKACKRYFNWCHSCLVGQSFSSIIKLISEKLKDFVNKYNAARKNKIKPERIR